MIKVYTVDLIDSSVSTEVAQLAGLPPHRHQANIFLAADSKAAAIRLVEKLPERWVGDLRIGRLRLASGNDVDALTAAGLFKEPTIIVTAGVGKGGDLPVVRVTDLGPDVFGSLVRGPALGMVTFEPFGTLRLAMWPHEVTAVQTLLAMVPDSDRARDLLKVVPDKLRPLAGGG